MKSLLQDSGRVVDILRRTEALFCENNIEGARAAAEILLAHVLKIERSRLFLDYERVVSPAELESYRQLVQRRLHREPVAYLTGKRGFWALDLEVSKHVLIPRPDTETLVEAALDVFPDQPETPLKVLDLGTGSGAVILSLAYERPGNTFVATDLSPAAVAQAAANAKSNGLGERVSFVTGRWFTPFNEETCRFDLIVSNPPYIPSADIPRLEPEIREHEPKLALDGDCDGLKCLEHIILTAPRFLKPGGWLLLEMGYDQREAVRALAEGSGFYEDVLFFNDYAGKNRAVRMRRI